MDLHCGCGGGSKNVLSLKFFSFSLVIYFVDLSDRRISKSASLLFCFIKLLVSHGDCLKLYFDWSLSCFFHQIFCVNLNYLNQSACFNIIIAYVISEQIYQLLAMKLYDTSRTLFTIVILNIFPYPTFHPHPHPSKKIIV